MKACIRLLRPEEMDSVLAIWLDASIKAHHFVEADVWRRNMSAMRDQYLPASENYVYQDGSGEVIGFFSLCDDSLAAIFVSPSKQGRGVGSALLRHAKALRILLRLTVYAENKASVTFYKNAGFKLLAEQVDVHTGQSEYLMQWDGD